MNTYQWIKGEKAGTVVKSDGSTILENNQEFLIFQDGSRCNTTLLGDYIMEIGSDNESDLILLNDVAPAPITKVVPKPKIKEEPVKVEKKSTNSPIFDLLANAKKEKRKMNLYIEMEFPPADLLKIVAASYENGSDLINDYVINELTNTQDKSIKTQIANELMKDFLAKPSKITRKKHDRL